MLCKKCENVWSYIFGNSPVSSRVLSWERFREAVHCHHGDVREEALKSAIEDLRGAVEIYREILGEKKETCLCRWPGATFSYQIKNGGFVVTSDWVSSKFCPECGRKL